MKSSVIKTIAITLILSVFLSYSSVLFCKANTLDEEEIDFPCGGVIEEVGVDILLAPLSSKIVIGDCNPIIEDIILKITYPNGEHEIIKVERVGDEYRAGDFSVFFSNVDAPDDYGVVKRSIYIDKNNVTWGGYFGTIDYFYIFLPSFDDILQLLSSYFKK